MTDGAHDLYGWTCFCNAETIACQNLLITLGMQFGEALAKLKLLAINREGAVGAFLALYGVGWQTVCVPITTNYLNCPQNGLFSSC